MFTRSKRRGFTLVELLVVIAIIGVLVALLLPAINAARQAALRNACTNNQKQLALAVLGYHNTFSKFPSLGRVTNISTYQSGGTGAPTASGGTDYSWLVRILPYLEGNTIYNEVSQKSNRFTRNAFDATNRLPNNSLYFWQIPQPSFICPSFTGESIRPPSDAPAYSLSIPADTLTGKTAGIAISNYVALTSSHMAALDSANTNRLLRPNGTLISALTTTLASMKDGTSKTAFITESKEQTNACWYDASSTWIVASRGTVTPIQAPATGTWIGGLESLNYGPRGNDVTPVYLDSSGGKRMWGPSSDHGDIVIHAFVDGSIQSLSATDLDPNHYLAYVTRAGNEKVPAPAQ